MKIWKTIIQQKKSVLIVFDDMIADMKSNKKLSPIVTEFYLRGRKLNISLVFISQYFFKVPKTMILNGTCYKRKLQQKKTSTNSISLALSSRNVSKYEYLTGKYFLPEKNFQQKKDLNILH